MKTLNIKTLNIKITVIETGEELLNEDTNAIICGIGDNHGDAAVISNINGTLKSIISALDAVKKAEKETIKNNPILKRIGETFGKTFNEIESEVEENA